MGGGFDDDELSDWDSGEPLVGIHGGADFVEFTGCRFCGGGTVGRAAAFSLIDRGCLRLLSCHNVKQSESFFHLLMCCVVRWSISMVSRRFTEFFWCREVTCTMYIPRDS